MSNGKIEIKLSDIINHLNNGVTRKVSSKAYNPELRSIEEIYGLPAKQVDRLFKHPSLIGKRVTPTIQDMFELLDDSVETTGETIISEETETVEELTVAEEPQEQTVESDGLDMFE